MLCHSPPILTPSQTQYVPKEKIFSQLKYGYFILHTNDATLKQGFW